MIKIINKLIIKCIRKPSRRAEVYKKQGIDIGENCEIFRNVSFGSEPYLIRMGNNVKITTGVKFVTHDGGMYVLRNLNLLPNADYFGTIDIGNNVFIGLQAIILPGTKIGNNVIIGARSVVTRDIPNNSVVAGVPAKVISTLDDYYARHKDSVDFTKKLSSLEKKEYLLKKFSSRFS